ncbi:nucleotidyltransferase-like protein [Sporosarcina obsidiansis]|uniref:nucleotidyltransferase-like protein n=1 Tax=Sporosarcina obsidiansis TaxID=2660748 RepID=UPI00129BC2AE|nr:nucleotidyltransferase-like protein [Sporosarcina obsidiansis]
MEQMLRPIYQERASQPDTLSVLLIENQREDDPTTDTFDEILFIISSNNEVPIQTKHYTDGQRKAAMHIISKKQLTHWLLVGTNKKIIDWLVLGKIYFDRDEYVERLKERLSEEPLFGRGIKMGMELSKMIRAYNEGKIHFERKQFMDAHLYAINSLHHLARLVAIKHNALPENTVWSQMKKVDPAVYKLYEELIGSEEVLEKRLDLVFLASEFYIHNYTNEASEHIMGILNKKDSWNIQELHEQEELSLYSSDLEFFIEYLVDKKLIKIVCAPSKNDFLFHREYRSSKALETK